MKPILLTCGEGKADQSAIWREKLSVWRGLIWSKWGRFLLPCCLLDHLWRNSLFRMSVGFRAHRSTKIALVKATNDLLMASHNWLVSLNVLLYFSAAFDINHPSILSQRVERVLGMKDTSLHWFRSYLSDRFQFVHVSDVLYAIWARREIFITIIFFSSGHGGSSLEYSF